MHADAGINPEHVKGGKEYGDNYDSTANSEKPGGEPGQNTG
jgi:hypothetical protein